MMSIAYCSTQCQRNDWKRHRPECVAKKKPAANDAAKAAAE